MDDTRDDGGPAYPQHISNPVDRLSGMSLRDWFAGQALTGLLANPDWSGVSAIETSFNAYSCADAMIAERAK